MTVGSILQEYDPAIHGIIAEADRLQIRTRHDGTNHLFKPYILDLWTSAASTNTAAELVNDQDNELDGSTTAEDGVKGYTNDAKDTAAGVGAQQLKVLSIISDEYSENTLTTAGATSDTDDSIDDMQRFIQMIVSAAGSELNNAGEIELRLSDDTVIHTIAAGENRLGTITLWIAPGYRAKCVKLLINNSDAAGAGAGANTIVDKIRVTINQSYGDVNPGSAIREFVWSGGSNLYQGSEKGDWTHQIDDICFPLNGVESSNIVKVYQTIESLDDGDATTVDVFARYLIWRETT